MLQLCISIMDSDVPEMYCFKLSLTPSHQFSPHLQCLPSSPNYSWISLTQIDPLPPSFWKDDLTTEMSILRSPETLPPSLSVSSLLCVKLVGMLRAPFVQVPHSGLHGHHLWSYLGTKRQVPSNLGTGHFDPFQAEESVVEWVTCIPQQTFCYFCFIPYLSI